MSLEKDNLKNVIEEFLSQTEKVIKLAKLGDSFINKEEIDIFAEKIWNLRHFANELLQSKPDESTQYNAKIVMGIVEAPFHPYKWENKELSLIEAADKAKNENQDKALIDVMKTWNQETTQRDVFLEDLEQIAEELAA